jgi:hypothetical protein
MCVCVLFVFVRCFLGRWTLTPKVHFCIYAKMYFWLYLYKQYFWNQLISLRFIPDLKTRKRTRFHVFTGKGCVEDYDCPTRDLDKR